MNFKKNKKETDGKEITKAMSDMDKLGNATVNGIKEADKDAIEKIDEEFLAEIKVQEEGLQKLYPDFDVAMEIEKNPMFAVMLSFREPMERVFYYFNPDVLYQEIEKEILDRIKARNLRPAHVEQRGKNGGYDVNNLSSSDIAEIDKRVRRGERVEL